MEIFLHRCRKITPYSFKTQPRNPKPSIQLPFVRKYCNSNQRIWSDIITLFSDKWSSDSVYSKLKQDLKDKVSKLKDEILIQNDDVEKIGKVLEENGVELFRSYSDGSAVVELYSQLKPSPHLALEILNWRRKQLDYASPMTAEEYAKGITMAGRSRNVDLAIELFNEAANKQLKTASIYNALMSAYTYNGLAMKCQSLFQQLKKEATCTPTIVTYNILISSFGRLMLVDHMKAALREIKDLNLSPTVNTYNGLIAGYITAWMWDEMENTYRIMKASDVKPDLDTDLLMLRGYAHCGKLEKMEQVYEMVRDHVNQKEVPLIRAMICAYCKSNDINKVKKIEELLRLIPENDYRPWLNVLLICLYAKEDLLERMEISINHAFEHNASVTTAGVMRCIISSYYRHNAVDKLADFVKRAESAGWKICRSLYHCKMFMYSAQMRLAEMERVLDEMDRVNMHCTKKTFWILHEAYSRWGQRSKLEQVLGMMCKHGYRISLDARSS